MAPSQPEWEEIGGRMEDRRLDLARFINRNWATLSAFCRDRGINYRLAQDIERARRDNYERGTLLMVEEAYGLTRGSIERARKGGEFGAVPGSPPITPRVRYQLRAIGEYIASQNDPETSSGS